MSAVEECRISNRASTVADRVHCNENPIYVFLFWELCGLSLNFHIHVSVSDFYIPRIGSHIWMPKIDRLILEIYKSLKDIQSSLSRGTVNRCSHTL